ncbi:Aryl-alcohol dehydrogenase [compost metagenome]
MVGVSPPGAEVTVPVMSLFFGQTLGGAVEGNAVPKILIPRLIELWRQGRFPFERMVKFYDFEQINQAVADSASGATLKAILRIGTTQA